MKTNKPILILGDLDGPEGNAFAMLGRARKVAKDYKLDWDGILADAQSSDYNHLVSVLDLHFDIQATGKLAEDLGL